MIPEELQEKFNKVVEAFQAFGAELTKTIAPALEAIIKIYNQCVAFYLENADPKLKHLALHSKKARVRKKNFNRIVKESTKGQI